MVGLAEFKPYKGFVALSEKLTKQEIESLRWYETNNEFLKRETEKIKESTLGMLNHMKLSQENRSKQISKRIRAADPFNRFQNEGRMFPFQPDSKYDPTLGPRKLYLKDRLSINPQQKYVLPQTTSMVYGWLANEKVQVLDTAMSCKSVNFARRSHLRM
ncbi:hypothetical protein WDU94_014273 [Cyamophila willieti]